MNIKEKVMFDGEEFEVGEAFSDYIESEDLTKLKDHDYATSLYEYAKKEYPDDDKYFKWLKIFIEKDE